MKKKKLELKKKVIAALSEVQKAKIIGGDDDTTSYEMCETMPTECGDDTCGPDCTQTCPTGDPVTCVTYNC